jgi:hypothetical protein
MANLTLHEMMQGGGGPFAWVYHVTGMPWAATNSTTFKTFIDSATADALETRRNLFGEIGNGPSYSAYDVQVLSILDHDLGSQRVKYDERKGIDVGSWTVKVNAGENSYTWNLDDDIPHVRGLLGLDFQPTPTSAGVVTGVLSRDFQNSGSPFWDSNMYWFVDRDNGLKDKIEAKIAAAEECYLWVGSSCLAVTGSTVTTTLDQNEYYIKCKQRQFRSPNELILNKVIGSEQMIQISNVPLGITGYTGILWAVPFDIETGELIYTTTIPDPIAWRAGKVLVNPGNPGRDVYTLSHSGFTQQLDYKVSPDNSFTGHVTGYTFNRMEITDSPYKNDYGVMQQPHIWIWEYNFSTGTIKKAELWCDSMAENGFIRFETLDAVKNDCVEVIATSSLDNDYFLSDDGDLVWDKGSSSDTYYAFMFGPVGWVCGFGYIPNSDALAAFTDQVGANANQDMPFYSKPRFKVNKPGGPKNGWLLEPAFQGISWTKAEYWLTLRESSDTTAENMRKVISLGVVDDPGHIKNLSEHAYYMQTDWNFGGINGADYIPKDNDGNRYLYFESDGDAISLEINDELTFGEQIGNGYRITAKVVSVAGDGRSCVLKGEELDGTALSNRINWFMYSMHWAKGWDLGEGLFAAAAAQDPFMMNDSRTVLADSASDVVKQLLGDASVDVGIPRRSRCTTVQDLHGITGERTMIDWDALEALIEKSGLGGVSYGLDLNLDAQSDEEKETTEKKTGQKFSIREAIANLCLTHGIRQAWEYNEAQRCWWLTFKPFTGDSVATASNSGRTLIDADIKPLAPSAVVGGDWVYSNLNIKIRNQSGGNDTFPVDKSVGKNQHKSGAKTLTINDTLTVIPTGDSDAKDTIVKRVANYLEIYSQEHYVERYRTTIRKLANLSVGSGVDFTSASSVDPTTGARGITNGYASLLGMTINLGSEMDVSVELRKSVDEKLGIAPTLLIADGQATRSSSVVSVTGASSTSWFTDPDGGLTDLATFGCYYYSVSDGTVREKDCSCGDFEVWLFERNNESLVYDAGTPTNNTVWSGSLGNINLSAGTYDITLDDTTNFDTINSANGAFVVIFADRDNANIQPCQLLYGFLGDSNGKVQDSGATDHSAIVWT